MPHVHPIPVPKVLCISGHDPGGGAGIQADIETVAALGGHALSVITALTVQDTVGLRRAVAVDAQLLAEQLDCLMEDGLVQAVKIGLIGSAEQLPVIARVLDRARVPVVCDPVLHSGGGQDFTSSTFVDDMRRLLFPRVTLMTPNAAEARRLVPGAATLDDCGQALLACGSGHVLVTGGDEASTEVINAWYAPGAVPQRFRWRREPLTFHGAGCTLAAAIAVRLAQGLGMEAALGQAQAWTQACLASSIETGRGRPLPLRRAPLAITARS